MDVPVTTFARFPDWPTLQGIRGERNRYTVVEPYRASWMGPDSVMYRVTVPAGFETNMASSPRIVWWAIGPYDLGPAALVHDWLYHTRGRVEVLNDDGRWVGALVTRREADRIMRQLCGSHPKLVTWWRRKLAWWFIRRFGLGNWTR